MKVFYTRGIDNPKIHPAFINLNFDKVFLERRYGRPKAVVELNKCVEILQAGDSLFINELWDFADTFKRAADTIKKLLERGVTLVIAAPQLILSPEQKALVLLAISDTLDAEKAWKVEKIQRGVEKKRRQDGRYGRPEILSDEQVEKIKDKIRMNVRIPKIAEEFSVTPQTIRNTLARRE